MEGPYPIVAVYHSYQQDILQQQEDGLAVGGEGEALLDAVSKDDSEAKHLHGQKGEKRGDLRSQVLGAAMPPLFERRIRARLTVASSDAGARPLAEPLDSTFQICAGWGGSREGRRGRRRPLEGKPASVPSVALEGVSAHLRDLQHRRAQDNCVP